MVALKQQYNLTDDTVYVVYARSILYFQLNFTIEEDTIENLLA